MRIALCDDEPMFVYKLKEALIHELEKRNEEYKIITTNDGNELLSICSSERIDAVFLDIVMPALGGFEVAERLIKIHNDIMIVFISNNNTMVYRSFEYNPIWFIPKNQMQWIKVAIDKIIAKYNESENKYSLISLKLGNETGEIDVRQVKYFKSDGHYINYFKCDGSKSKSYRVKLSDIEMQLKNLWFVRTHNRFLVNLRLARSISNMKLLLSDNEEIPISQAQKEEVSSRLVDYFRSTR